jgi:hypothetical protein
MLKADMQDMENRVRRGELIDRAEVDAGRAEAQEIIRSDLLGTLPLRIAALLAGKVEAVEARQVVITAVREMLSGWHKAGIPTPEEAR